MTKLTEIELILPFLKVLEMQGGEASTEQVKTFIRENFPLSEEDKTPSKTRKNEEIWEQQVRNLIAHETLENRDYILRKEKGLYSITEEGRKHLETHREALTILLASGFNRDDIIEELKNPKPLLKEISIIEGKKQFKQTTTYCRSKELRDLAIKKFSLNSGKIPCKVCKFNFEDRYEDIGRGFIEIHHLKPVCDLGEIETSFAKAFANLAPLCSNCHRIVHRKNPCFTLEEMSRILIS